MKTRGLILACGLGGMSLVAVAQTTTPSVLETPAPAQKNLLFHPAPLPPSEDEAHAAKIKDWAQRLAAGDSSARAELQEHHASGLNCEVAWVLYNQHQVSLARDLFLEALSWNPEETQAKQGLFYTYKQLGDQKSAALYLTSLPSDQQASQKTAAAQRPPGEDYAAEAVRFNQAGQYDKALAALSKVHPLNRGLRMMRAWIYFHQNNFSAAQAEFEQLYRSQPDVTSGQGLFLCAQRLGTVDGLRSDPQLNSGPLAVLLRKDLAQQFYDDADYYCAYQAAPQIDPGLKNFDSPWVSAGMVYRHKDGTAGLGRVDEELLPSAEGAFNLDPVDQLHFQVARLTLDSGRLNDDLLYGTAPIVPTPRKFATITDYPELILPEIDFHHDGFTSINASLGTTPLDAVIYPLPTGKLELVQQVGGSFWSVGAFSKSNTESLLSYAGARDPYTGKTWGRVVEAGGRADGFLDLGHDWGFYGSGAVSGLVGDNVKDNDHLTISLNVSRNFILPGFQYLSVGPDFSFDHFERNEDFYTYGQGGYFSPDAIAEGGLAMSFLTKESRRFLADGYLSAGAQTNHQAGSPFLPLAPDGRSYPGNSDSSLVFSAHARLAYLITDHWETGAFFSYSKSAEYNEAIAGISFRYYFDPRVALFRNDLPTMAQ